MKNMILMIIGVLSYSSLVLAGGGTWSEFGDAPSFPDGQAQVTRGEGDLFFISGSTAATDPRDSYCIKISNPSSFQVTSDTNINGFATANFDTRLFLFDKKGKPILFNDDTPPSSSPFASTLTGVATDGSGYVLSQPGEYILVVAGFSDDPLDNIANNLFNQSASLVHAPIPNSNHFSLWENSSPATGNYALTLTGVSFCQDKLDIVGRGSSLTNNSQMCLGDGNGSFNNCHNQSINSVKNSIALGYLDQDQHLDVIFDVYNQDIPSICLGNGKGGYKSCFVYTGLGTENTSTAVMGDINNDGFTDAIFLAIFENHQVCLGNGTGSFTSCSDLPNSDAVSNYVHLAYMDGDNKLDLIYSNFNSLFICTGVGDGTFNTCVSTIAPASTGLEIADANNDGINDIIVSIDGAANKICLNDGSGGLTCSDINAQVHRSFTLAVKDINNDGNIDAVFANFNGSNQVCLGDGSGAMTCNDVSGVSDNYTDVKLGLLNDDNFLDVVFAGVSAFTRICLGNGDGTFGNCVNDSSLKFSNIELGEFGEPLPDGMFSDGFE